MFRHMLQESVARGFITNFCSTALQPAIATRNDFAGTLIPAGCPQAVAGQTDPGEFLLGIELPR